MPTSTENTSVNWLDVDGSEQSNSEISDPQEALIRGIVTKDIVLVQEAIAAQADLKKLVGKEKMGVFALTYFEEDVVNLLSKHGVSFKDFGKSLEKIAQTDNPQALIWFIKTSAAQKNLQETAQIKFFVSNFVQAGAVDCLEYIKNNMDQKIYAEFNNVSVPFFKDGIKQAIKKPPEQVLNFIKLIPSSDVILKGVLKTILGANTSNFQQHEFSKFSLQEIQSLQALIDDQPNLKADLFPCALQCYLPNAKSIQNFLKNDFLDTQKVQSLFIHFSNDAQNLTEIVVQSCSSLCVSLSSHPKFKSNLEEILSNPQKLLFFLLSDNKTTITKVFKNIPSLLSKTIDNNGNTVAHYLVCVPNKSERFYKDIFSINPQAFLVENNDNKTLFDIVPSQIASQFQKTMLSKGLKKTVTQKVQTSARKM